MTPVGLFGFENTKTWEPFAKLSSKPDKSRPAPAVRPRLPARPADPDADPARKATVQRLNEGAYASLLAARAAYRAGRAPDVAAVESASEQVKAAVPVEGAK